MPEQWLPARKAFEIIPDEDALISRLGSGLLQARGRIRLSDDKPETLANLPLEFWQHDIYFDFDRNWETGDFTNSIGGAEAVSAFDVCIKLAGLLEMVPFEKRGLLARSLSVAGNNDWMTAQAARALLFNTPVNPASAGNWIIEQGRMGFVIARAVQAQSKIASSSREWSWEEREWDVPTWFWAEFTARHNSAQNWGTGLFSGSGRTPQGNGAMTLTGIHFHKRTTEGLLGLNNDPGGQLVESTDAETKRGRRPTYDWQAAISAVWGQLHRGELKAETQAVIEQAMIAFLKHGDQEPSESTVRPYAKTIFEEFIKP